MSASLKIALKVPCDRFTVELDWETEERALGLFGASGAGKTSLLAALAGIRPAAGRIEVGGRVWLDSSRRLCLPPETRGVGYVPQDLLLFPHLDVRGNLQLGQRRAARPVKVSVLDRVVEVLELGPLLGRGVSTLSGGERQRVAIGRALCSEPSLLLLDEPLASLDHRLRRKILPYLLRVRRELGITALHVSHDAAEMSLLADEVSILEAGRCIARGGPQVVFGSARGSSGSVVNVIEGEVIDLGAGLATLEVAPGLELCVADDGDLSLGARVAIELRGSDILLALGDTGPLSAQNNLPGEVRSLGGISTGDAAGVVVVCAVGAGARDLAALVTQRAVEQLGLAPGCLVRVVFKAQSCRLLAAR